MPLPVIFKFLSDTTGLKFGEVDRGLNDMKVSSQKAGMAVKSLAGIIKSGQEPIEALANSVSNLTRAFGLGVGATVAVVGVVEVIKSFVAESQKLNTISDKLNTNLKALQDNAGTLDFAGAVKQIKSLTSALGEAREQSMGEKGGILGRTGRSIADLIGLSEYRFQYTQDAAKNELALLRTVAKTALQKEVELESIKSINPLEAKRLEIEQKYFDLEQQLKKINADKETFLLMQFRKSQELVNLDEEAAKEKAKTDEEAKKAIEERIRLGEQEIKKQEELNEKRNRALSEYSLGIDEINKKRLAGATPLIDRLLSAAETLGIKGLAPVVEKGRKETETKLAKTALERFGISERDITARGSLFPSAQERISGLLGIEAEQKKLEDERLFESVYGIEKAVMDLKQTIEEKLGVPILRSAAGT
jgi:hypothetical protein